MRCYWGNGLLRKRREKVEGGVHGRGGISNVGQRSVGLMVAGGNISWDRMSVSAMTRDGFCFYRRESEIQIIQILTPRQYCGIF